NPPRAPASTKRAGKSFRRPSAFGRNGGQSRRILPDMQGPLLRVLIVALVLLVAAMLAIPRAPLPEPDNATVLPLARPLPDFELTDARGAPFTKSSLEGRFTLMF